MSALTQERYVTYNPATGYAINWPGFYNPDTGEFDRTITQPLTVEQAAAEARRGTPFEAVGA